MMALSEWLRGPRRPRRVPYVPLDMYLSPCAVALTAAYHASLLLGIIAPDHTMLLAGQSFSIRFLFLPMAYVLLVMLVEVYGLRLAVRLALVGLAVFAVMVVIVVAGLALPSAPHQASLARVSLGLLLFAVLGGFLVGTALALWWISFRRIEGRPRRFAARLLLIPFLANLITTFALLGFYFGPTAIPHPLIHRVLDGEPLTAIYCILLAPLGYLGTRAAQVYEQGHQKRVNCGILDAARTLSRTEI